MRSSGCLGVLSLFVLLFIESPAYATLEDEVLWTRVQNEFNQTMEGVYRNRERIIDHLKKDSGGFYPTGIKQSIVVRSLLPKKSCRLCTSLCNRIMYWKPFCYDACQSDSCFCTEDAGRGINDVTATPPGFNPVTLKNINDRVEAFYFGECSDYGNFVVVQYGQVDSYLRKRLDKASVSNKKSDSEEAGADEMTPMMDGAPASNDNCIVFYREVDVTRKPIGSFTVYDGKEIKTLTLREFSETYHKKGYQYLRFAHSPAVREMRDSLTKTKPVGDNVKLRAVTLEYYDLKDPEDRSDQLSAPDIICMVNYYDENDQKVRSDVVPLSFIDDEGDNFGYAHLFTLDKNVQKARVVVLDDNHSDLGNLLLDVADMIAIPLIDLFKDAVFSYFNLSTAVKNALNMIISSPEEELKAGGKKGFLKRMIAFFRQQMEPVVLDAFEVDLRSDSLEGLKPLSIRKDLKQVMSKKTSKIGLGLLYESSKPSEPVE